MDRREFIKVGVSSSVVARFSAPAKAVAKKQPNILYVFSDQHRAASLPGEPFNEAKAPNIDAFRHANLSMDLCVSNYPLCTPHRGILMTGKYPAKSGIDANGRPMKTSEFALTQAFKQAGYRTGYVGKWHLGNDRQFIAPGPERFGVDDWHVWGMTNNHYHSYTFDPVTGAKISPEGWSPVPMTDQAIDFMKARAAEKTGQPWLLILSFNPPHPPFDPPAEDQAPYAGALKSRPNLQLPAAGGAEHVANEAQLHRAVQGYYGGITGVDEQFGRLVKAVGDLGLADDTIVIYTSDHGEMLGSQGKMAKQMPWDESCRVPFAIRYPSGLPTHANSNTLFSSIDIYPTLCGLAGINVPAHCAGRNLADSMRGKSGPTPEFAFLQNGPGSGGATPEDDDDGEGQAANNPQGAAPAPAEARGKRRNGGGGAGAKNAEANATKYRGLRSATHTYAVTEEGRWLLYDNTADPYQLKNLAKDPAQSQVMAHFDEQMRGWLRSTGDTFAYPHAL